MKLSTRFASAAFICSAAFCVLMMTGCASTPDTAGFPEIVSSVEIERYLGLWYQVASYPHFFQDPDCPLSTAHYSLREDGRIRVENNCWADEVDGERLQTVTAVAWPADETNAWLKVRFYGLFTADYLIIELDEEYHWAVVTTPDTSTLWILCREPALEEALYQEIIGRLQDRGFPRENIIRTSLQRM